MGKKKIIWSNRAEEEFKNILEFYIERNKSLTYSLKLIDSVEALTTLLIKNNYLGRLTENGITRVLIKGNYLIFYEVHKSTIEIVSVWDNRQDPEKRFA